MEKGLMIEAKVRKKKDEKRTKKVCTDFVGKM
jgi:hypothetical protein